MEEWFHDCNRKEEVANSRTMIAKVLQMFQDLFPREEGTNGYCIPKMHAMTKLMFYTQRYGSAMSFFGGTGESAHKFFVKAPGLKTQRSVKEFCANCQPILRRHGNSVCNAIDRTTSGPTTYSTN